MSRRRSAVVRAAGGAKGFDDGRAGLEQVGEASGELGGGLVRPDARQSC